MVITGASEALLHIHNQRIVIASPVVIRRGLAVVVVGIRIVIAVRIVVIVPVRVTKAADEYDAPAMMMVMARPIAVT
jgi:hypothetical protein